MAQKKKNKNKKNQSINTQTDDVLTNYFNLLNIKNEINKLQKTLNNKKTELKEMEKNITDKKLATILSDHALAQIMNRLEDLTAQSSSAYNILFNSDVNIKDSLFIPSNLKTFIFNSMKNALTNNTYKSKKSKSGGVEYIFNIYIPEFDTEDKKCVLTMIVENSTIKTGFFNLIDE